MCDRITLDDSAWPNASRSFPAKVASSYQHPELVHDDRVVPTTRDTVEMSGESVPPSDFEGFGSFC